MNRGFYDEPFVVEITSATEGALIRYTTDGSPPTETYGTLYTEPVQITTTTVLRAIAYMTGWTSTNVDTQTYIFIDDVIAQGNRPAGYPTAWKNVSGQADLPADYEMDPQVTENPLYKDKMRASLLSIPTVSLVTEIGNLFNRSTGIYMNPLSEGDDWERPVSVEWIYPNGQKGIQINGGVRIQGGHTRDPRKNPKHSLRLVFRKEAYGKGKLEFPVFPEPDATERFDTIILRGGGNQSWLHHNEFRGDNRGRAQYIRDQFAKDMQGRMGGPYLHNSYAFLYINGLFWGLYNPSERATNAFGESYLGGVEDDYDAINSGKLLDGTADGWNELLALVNQNLALKTNYDKVAELLELTHFTDYMLLNHWGGNEDWDHHNWYALRNRLGGKFYFFAWDSEFFFETAGANVTGKNTKDNPGAIFHSLLKNTEYRLLVADRIHKHFNNDGILTTKQALQVWEERNAQVYEALIAESARWGDYRRDVHRAAGPYELYTRDNQWEKERQRLVPSLIPSRNRTTYLQYRNLGLIPTTAAAEFSRNGGILTDKDPLTMSTTTTGEFTIYYTLDGSDPRLEGGEVSSAALVYNEPIRISTRTRVQARVRKNNVWSPLQSGDFHPAGDPADLQISEILYAPLATDSFAGKDLEFLEVRNSGPGRISLDQVELDGGIDFAFPSGLFLEAGEHIVVVSNLAAFQAQHGGVRIAGQYAGQLSNEGERITLRHAGLGIIQEVVYSDWYPWPKKAAVAGHSLIPVSLGERGAPNQSTAWRASAQPGGSPGVGEFPNARWLHDATFGWVWSASGEVSPGAWLYGASGFFYFGADGDQGSWIWNQR